MTRKYNQGVADANRRRTKHGATINARQQGATRLYRVWNSTKDRCLNPNAQHYHRYGGRGVTICEEWTTSFAAFARDVGEPPKGASLDRIDNNKGYEPGNIRWANRKEQSNNRDNNVRVEWRGETKTLAEWAEVYGWKYGLLASRWKRGLRGQELFAPPKVQRNAMITYAGKTQTLGEWAVESGVSYYTLYWRVKNGKPLL